MAPLTTRGPLSSGGRVDRLRRGPGNSPTDSIVPFDLLNRYAILICIYIKCFWCVYIYIYIIAGHQVAVRSWNQDVPAGPFSGPAAAAASAGKCPHTPLEGPRPIAS